MDIKVFSIALIAAINVSGARAAEIEVQPPQTAHGNPTDRPSAEAADSHDSELSKDLDCLALLDRINPYPVLTRAYGPRPLSPTDVLSQSGTLRLNANYSLNTKNGFTYSETKKTYQPGSDDNFEAVVNEAVGQPKLLGFDDREGKKALLKVLLQRADLSNPTALPTKFKDAKEKKDYLNLIQTAQVKTDLQNKCFADGQPLHDRAALKTAIERSLKSTAGDLNYELYDQ